MIYVAEADSVLTYLGTFKYWPEVMAVLGSVAVAWFTAWRTSRSEVLRSLRTKRMEAYEEVLSLYGKLIQDAQYIFSEEFSAETAMLGLKIRTYGSKQVESSYSEALKELNEQRTKCLEAEIALENKYMPEERFYDDDGTLIVSQTHALIGVQEYEEMVEEEIARWTPDGHRLGELFNPVIKAIRTSSLKARD